LKNVGFTTSIPVEVLFAAGLRPIDLNNIFITHENPERLLEKAENAGFPRNTCAWIKGIFSAVLLHGNIDTIIGVIEGDCSNTKALIEVFELYNIKCVPFSYPNSRNYRNLEAEILSLCRYFNVTLKDCSEIKNKLDTIRKKLIYLDELTWKSNKARGFENHIWQVSSSDFNGDYELFDAELDRAITEIEERQPLRERIRLGYIGVPPINGDLYSFIETLDARIVYNEVQRQFAMPCGVDCEDIVEMYRMFTYPYNLSGRLSDIKNEISKRKLNGVIHYTQAFCFRGIEDIIIRKELGIPVLTLEGDRPGNLDQRTKLRLESFIDMLY